MHPFVEMLDMLALQRGQQQQNPMRRLAHRSISSTTNMMNTMRPMGITIPESDGEQKRRRRKQRSAQVNPSDPHGKRPMGQKKKKGPAVGTLTTKTNIMILVPLNEEKEEIQLRETLQCSIVEKRAPNVPYLENVGLSGLK